jgi:hypothetical protein
MIMPQPVEDRAHGLFMRACRVRFRNTSCMQHSTSAMAGMPLSAGMLH